MTHQKENNTEHEFDGVYETDNNVRLWWIYFFYFSFCTAVCYIVWFYIPGLPNDSFISIQDNKIKKNEVHASGENEPFDFAKASKNKKIIADGQVIYLKTCAVCHGQVGEGTIGPNLTDRFWIHGSRYEDLVRVLNEGVPAKGMPAWGQMLGELKTNKVLAYVISLQGTNPPNAKEPQGEEGDLH